MFFQALEANVNTSRTSASISATTSAISGMGGWDGVIFYLDGGGYCHFFPPCAVIASCEEASRVLCFFMEFL